MSERGPHKLLVLDLDGTLLIGDEPALDHALELARMLDARAPGSGTRLLGRVESFLSGATASRPSTAPDGYLAARSFALDAGLGEDEIATAFLAHRARMAAGGIPFHAPAGAASLIAAVRSTVEVALVTNAPNDGLPAILGTLHLADAFDHVVGDAGKPTGLPRVVARLLARSSGASDFGLVFSVGDIWENDLAPLASLGATTGYIDRHRSGRGTPTHRSTSFDQLAPAILEWAARPSSV